MSPAAAPSRYQLLRRKWPAAELETVPLCPVCQSGQREKLYGELWDNTALVAPGSWSLWRCKNCGCAFLSPRPTRDSIGRAYEAYYTHAGEHLDDVANSAVFEPSLRRRLANGYRNWRFGTTAQPASKLGQLIGRCVPAIRRSSDYKYRYLPLSTVAAPKVLDLGCGNGRWLSTAAHTRWEGYGSDPDPKAVEEGRAKGLAVRQGGLDAWADTKQYFDAITMSHVIEHVHDPREILIGALRLLKPGGHVCVETPNINALGHRWFGRAWRGLEPPRHLVLFSRLALIQLMRDVGFVNVQQQRAPSPIDFIISVSEDLELLEYGAAGHQTRSALAKWLLRTRAKWTGAQSEFLIITGERSR